jgi:hypothetical protein
MTKLHGGTHNVQGQLNRTKPRPNKTHGGSGAPLGTVHKASAPRPPQSSTSWHAMAAASQKRK